MGVRFPPEAHWLRRAGFNWGRSSVVEQSPLKRLVDGSNPSGLTLRIQCYNFPYMSDVSSVKVACDVIITQKNQLLLGKRGNCYGAGTWALPGGHLEIGEKLVDTARREIKEELDIDAKDLRLIAITDPLIMPQYVHVAFLLENYEGEYKLMEPDKCEEWKFFDLDKLPKNILPTHQDIIRAFKESKIYLY